jgi:hypothetical protein
MSISAIIFILIAAFCFAKLEISIEGRDGWAANLPTWRKSNALIKFVFGDYPITGYHFWMVTSLLLMLHLPLVMGIEWSLSLELKMISSFIFALIVEDFLWFVLNPAFGLKKFRRGMIPWHKQWFLGVPTGYIPQLVIALIILIASYYV